MSHDINSDYELWEMTDTLGDRSLRIWLEILSIGDRNEGSIAPWSDSFARSIGFKCHSNPTKVRQVWDHALRVKWLTPDKVARLANYSKYHKTRGTNKLPSYPSEPYEPSEPSLPNKRKIETLRVLPPPSAKAIEEDEHRITVEGLVEGWNEAFVGKLSQVTWPLTEQRRRKAMFRIREHPDVDWWSDVFTKIGESRFCMGQNDRGWRCDFNFLIANAENCLKIMEGKYDNQTNQKNQRR